MNISVMLITTALNVSIVLFGYDVYLASSIYIQIKSNLDMIIS